MPWFRVDDNLGFHHKVIAAGNPAMGLWVRAGSVSASQLTDGFVPDHLVSVLGTTAQAKKLVEVGLWDRTEGGYTFHEWDERQPRRADVEAERAAAKERMKAARERKRRAAQEASPQVSEPRSEDVRANVSRSSGEVRETFGDPNPTQPDPTRPNPPRSNAPDADAPRPKAERKTRQAFVDFEPNESCRNIATERGVDLQAEYVKLRDWATANAEKKADWQATFRNWLRNAKSERPPQRPSNVNGFLADLRAGGYGPEAIG